MKISDIQDLIKDYYANKSGKSLLGALSYYVSADIPEILVLKNFLSTVKGLPIGANIEGEHLERLVEIISQYEEDKVWKFGGTKSQTEVASIYDRIYDMIKNDVIEAQIKQISTEDLEQQLLMQSVRPPVTLKARPAIMDLIFKHEKNKLLNDLKTQAMQGNSESRFQLGKILMKGLYEGKDTTNLKNASNFARFTNSVPERFDDIEFAKTSENNLICTFEQGKEKLLALVTMNSNRDYLFTKLVVESTRFEPNLTEGLAWLMKSYSDHDPRASILIAEYYAGAYTYEVVDNAQAQEYLKMAVSDGVQNAKAFLNGDLPFHQYSTKPQEPKTSVTEVNILDDDDEPLGPSNR